MRTEKDMLWTWLLPDAIREFDRRVWIEHGGKWIIFDRRNRIRALAEKLGPLIDRGEIESAKYWNEDPSAICVYCLDKDKDRTWDILKRFGAGNSKVWEYDYAMDKNLKDPLAFVYSWGSKFRTIFQSYGIIGSIRLAREILKRR